MRMTRPLGIVAVLALAGCKLSSDLPTSRPLGVINQKGVQVAPNTYATAPVGVFFNASGITTPDSRYVVDSCTQTIYPIDTGATPKYSYLDAGPNVSVQTDLASGQLKPDTSLGGLVSYVVPGDSLLPFTPGAPITFTVPGATNGYPAISLAAATAGPYTFGPIDTLPDPTAFTITWSPAAGTGSAMVISLQFATGSTATAPDQQIYCSLVDDGSVTIPQRLASLWRTATPGTRHLSSYRWHTSFLNSGPAGLLVISEYDEEKSTFP